jgi:hemolysin III
LSVAALVVLVLVAVHRGNAWHVVGFTIFGSTLILLYLSSTLYHGIQHPRAKRILRRCDHAAIFLLIAGTYTPFLLTNLRGPWGWSLLGVLWGLAACGVLFKAFCIRRFERLSVVAYILMGWLGLVALRQLFTALPTESLLLLGVGGLIYTVGVVFYAWGKLPFGHAVWHLFVLGGSISHFFSVLHSV